MRRETRANLWFLVVFLVLILPGGILLFRKKLNPSASRMDQPDQVNRQLPYMTPPPYPPGMKWIVPPLTRRWLAGLAREKAGSDGLLSAVPPGPEWEPVISGDHLLQVVSLTRGASSQGISLILWNGSLPIAPSAYDVTLGSPPHESRATVNRVERVVIPAEVRREWVSLGFDHPPTEVTWIEASAAQSGTSEEHVRVDCPDASPPVHSSADFHVDATQP